MKYLKDKQITKKPIIKYYEKETSKALKYFFLQMNKGWTAQEAMEQVTNSYGIIIREYLLYRLAKYFNYTHRYNNKI